MCTYCVMVSCSDASITSACTDSNASFVLINETEKRCFALCYILNAYLVYA